MQAPSHAAQAGTSVGTSIDLTGELDTSIPGTAAPAVQPPSAAMLAVAAARVAAAEATAEADKAIALAATAKVELSNASRTARAERRADK